MSLNVGLQEDLERSIARKLEDVISRILEKQDRMAEFLRGAIQNDMNTVMSRSDMVVAPRHGVKSGVGSLKDAMEVLYERY